MARLGPGDLSPTALWQRFRAGTAAVELHGDQRVARLWHELRDLIRSAPFWENGILDFARNHVAGQMNIGDLYRFVPGNFGYIARKTVLYREEGQPGIRTIPGQFWVRGQPTRLRQDVLELTWALAEDVRASAIPDGFRCPQQAVSLEILKYPDSIGDLTAVFDLLADASGGWGRVGRRIDWQKAQAHGLFNQRYIRDAFALGCLVPGVRQALQAINASLGGDRDCPPGSFVIGLPHTDTDRSVTMLSGDRTAIKTEVHDAAGWHELALTTQSLFLFPSTLHSAALGVEPTVHRYSLRPPAADQEVDSPNVTVMIGLVDLQSQRAFA